jgi:hypothetical protein
MVSPSSSLRTGLSNHERMTGLSLPCLPFTRFGRLRTGFDKLRANGMA